MALVPKVQWAQRRDKLYVTIDLQDVEKPIIDIRNNAEGNFGTVSFKGLGRSHATGSEKHDYSLDLELYKVVLALDGLECLCESITISISRHESFCI